MSFSAYYVVITIFFKQELDHEATRSVNILLETVDDILYGDVGSFNSVGKCIELSDNLQSECHEWQKNFAHLRIAGHSGITAQDQFKPLEFLTEEIYETRSCMTESFQDGDFGNSVPTDLTIFFF